MFSMKVKGLFFDAPKVLRAVDKAKRKVLSRAGAFIRRTARQSIRKRKATSLPGKPPSSHEGSLKRGIFFSYDPQNDSVIIGPVGFAGSEAPAVLEGGGTVTVTQRRRGQRVKRRVRIKPRPYMGPALAKERPNLPKRWANSVRG